MREKEKENERKGETVKKRDGQPGLDVYSIHFVHPLATPFYGTDEFHPLPWQLVLRKLTGDLFLKGNESYKNVEFYINNNYRFD